MHRAICNIFFFFCLKCVYGIRSRAYWGAWEIPPTPTYTTYFYIYWEQYDSFIILFRCILMNRILVWDSMLPWNYESFKKHKRIFKHVTNTISQKKYIRYWACHILKSVQSQSARRNWLGLALYLDTEAKIKFVLFISLWKVSYRRQ